MASRRKTENLIKRGQLDKKGHRLGQGYHARIVTLTPGNMTYDDEKGNNRADTDCSEIRSIVKTNDRKGHFTFSVFDSAREYKFSTTSHDEREDWIEAFNRASGAEDEGAVAASKTTKTEVVASKPTINVKTAEEAAAQEGGGASPRPKAAAKGGLDVPGAKKGDRPQRKMSGASVVSDGSAAPDEKGDKRKTVSHPQTPLAKPLDTYTPPPDDVIATVIDVKTDIARLAKVFPQLVDVLAELGGRFTQLCICGTQSAGKSTTLEYITRTPCAFKAPNVGTTRPIVYHVKRGETASGGVEFAIAEGLSAKRTPKTEPELQQRLTELQHPGGKPCFDEQPIEVYVDSPEAYTITIIDLPGFQDPSQPNASKIYATNMKYLCDDHSLLLVLRPAQQQWENPDSMYIEREIKIADPTFCRTIVANNRSLDHPALDTKSVGNMEGVDDAGVTHFPGAHKFFFDVMKDGKTGVLKVPMEPTGARDLIVSAEQAVAEALERNPDVGEVKGRGNLYGIKALGDYIRYLIIPEPKQVIKESRRLVTRTLHELTKELKMLESEVATGAPERVLQSSLRRFWRSIADIIGISVRNSSFGYTTEDERDGAERLLDDIGVSGRLRTRWEPEIDTDIFADYELEYPVDMEFAYSSTLRVGGPALARLIGNEIPELLPAIAIPKGTEEFLESNRGLGEYTTVASLMEVAENNARAISLRLYWPLYLRFVRHAFAILILMLDGHIFANMATLESAHNVDNVAVWQSKLKEWFKDYLKECLFPQAFKIGDFLFKSRLGDFGSAINRPVSAAEHFDNLVELNRTRFQEDVSNVLGIVVKDAFASKNNEEFVDFLEKRYDNDLAAGVIDSQAILDECEKDARERQEMLGGWKKTVDGFDAKLKAFVV